MAEPSPQESNQDWAAWWEEHFGRAPTVVEPTTKGGIKQAALRAKLSEAQNHRCPLCGYRMGEPTPTLTNPRDYAATIEHIQQRKFGGTNEWENLAASHAWCNERRPNIKDQWIMWARWK